MSFLRSHFRRIFAVAALLFALCLCTAPRLYAAAPTDTDPTQEQQVVDLVNHYRVQHHCKPLTVDPILSQIALAHSVDMMTHNFFSHNGSDGSTPWQRMHKAGYTYSRAGENIAGGYKTAQDAFNAWIKSAPHRHNIANCRFKDTGVGLSYGGGNLGYYWTQDFGARA